MEIIKGNEKEQGWLLGEEIPCIDVKGQMWRKSIWLLENVSLLQGIEQRRQKIAYM